MNEEFEKWAQGEGYDVSPHYAGGYIDPDTNFANDAWQASRKQAVWQPIETAPKGGGARSVTDPAWVPPPTILLYFPNSTHKIVSCYWDWYYAPDGNGYCGTSAWVEPTSGEVAALTHDEPTHWMPPPPPPEMQKD